MGELKTKQNNGNVAAFVRSLQDPDRRRDCETLRRMMARITGKRARMWGERIVGFGKYQYTYASGWSGEYFVTGFSPRTNDLTIYIMPGFDRYHEQLEKFGRYRLGKSCLYLKSLGQANMPALESMISDSVRRMTEMYQCDVDSSRLV